MVTSPTGAAIRDFLQVLGRRWRGADVLVVPVRVQGEGAAAEIAAAIRTVNRLNERAEEGSEKGDSPRPTFGRCPPERPEGCLAQTGTVPLFRPFRPIDCLVVTRGGGSMEDLWAFNEEPVVRAIAASRIPVISAVGHEIDVTLSDLAADVRALTPSEAAELVAPAAEELVADLRQVQRRMAAALRCASSRPAWGSTRLPGTRPFAVHIRGSSSWAGVSTSSMGMHCGPFMDCCAAPGNKPTPWRRGSTRLVPWPYWAGDTA